MVIDAHLKDVSSDSGGLVTSVPDEVEKPQTIEELSQCLARCSRQRQPVVVRGGGQTTEGESVAQTGERMIHLRDLNRFLSLDYVEGEPTAWVEAGMTFQELDTHLLAHDLTVQSTPLNLHATVGGTVGVGGIDVNSVFKGCVADQVLECDVVLPDGEIIRCSERENQELFEDVLYGYGQFGVVSRVRLPARPQVDLQLEFLYYTDLSQALSDLMIFGNEALCDQMALLSLRDEVVALILGFESDQKRKQFQEKRDLFSGHQERALWFLKAGQFLRNPASFKHLPFLLNARSHIMKSLGESTSMKNLVLRNRLQTFHKLIWNFWGHRPIVIPDLSLSLDRFVEGVLAGNEICRERFKKYTLYGILVKRKPWSRRYDLGPFPQTSDTLVGGIEFEPLLAGSPWNFQGIQDFKDQIYDLGCRYQGRAYRFGGLMKHHVEKLCGPEAWQRFLTTKNKWDPQNILNPQVLQ